VKGREKTTQRHRVSRAARRREIKTKRDFIAKNACDGAEFSLRRPTISQE
jgi:hypothetical protein